MLTGAAVTALVVARGGGHAAGAGPEPSAAASPRAAAAAGGCPTGASLPLPADFPAALPLPDGAFVTSVARRSGGRLIVSTMVRGGFPAALSFVRDRLPEAGYTPADGEVGTYAAEADFHSPAVEGRWRLRTVPGCPGGVCLTYVTAPKAVAPAGS